MKDSLPGRIVGGESSTDWPAFRNYARASDFAKGELKSRHFDLAIVPRWDADWYYSSFMPIVELSWSERDAILIPSSIVNRFKPWKVPHRIRTPEHAMAPCSGACRARKSDCIRGITVEMAKEAVLEQLRKGAYVATN
jgi:hypothetical protein